ncbi:MAG TPA: pyrimidine reductase family protein [Thermopolyspora sp.]
MRRIHPEPAEDVDIPTAYAYPDGPWLRLNMVCSADGGAWLKGLSGGLSSEGDQHIFMTLRGLADVVLAGAATVRAEGYGPVKPRPSWDGLRVGRPPTPPLALVTRRLDLDLGSTLFTETEPYARTIVITTESAPRDRLDEAATKADVIIAGADRVDLTLALALLRERGHRRVLCEGGPRLNGQLTAAGLVDELCLTVNPMLVGGGASRILNGTSVHTRLDLVHVLEEDGFLFCRYVRKTT